jgi:hypothetical protein
MLGEKRRRPSCSRGESSDMMTNPFQGRKEPSSSNE